MVGRVDGDGLGELVASVRLTSVYPRLCVAADLHGLVKVLCCDGLVAQSLELVGGGHCDGCVLEDWENGSIWVSRSVLGLEVEGSSRLSLENFSFQSAAAARGHGKLWTFDVLRWKESL